MDFEEALKLVVNKLDEMMEESPSRQLADVSNYLQAMLDDLNA